MAGVTLYAKLSQRKTDCVSSAIAASIVRLAVIMAITSRGFDYTEDEDCMSHIVSSTKKEINLDESDC